MYSAAIGSNHDIDQLLDAASDDCSVFRVGKMNDVLSIYISDEEFCYAHSCL